MADVHNLCVPQRALLTTVPPSGGVAVFPPVFGSDFGREILLDDVQCNGTEEALDDCPATTGDQHDCSHEEDAGVQCYRASGRSHQRAVKSAQAYH